MASGVTSGESPTQSRTDEDVREADLRKLARGSSLNLAGSVVAAALNLVLPVLVTRSLTKVDAGVFFQTTALFTILMNVGTIGADTGLLRTLPQAIAHTRPADVRAAFRIAVLPAVALSTALAGTLFVLAGPIGDLATGGGGAAASSFAGVLRLLSPVLPVAVVYTILMSATRGLGSVRPLVLLEKLGRGSLQLVAVAVTLAVSGSVLLTALAWALPYGAALVVATLWVGRMARNVVRRLAARSTPNSCGPSNDLWSDFWRFSAPRAISRVFSVALQRFDIVVVGAIRGPSDAAIYAAATRFPIFGLLFVQAIQQVMAPRISEFLTSGERGRALVMYRTTTAWLTLVSWPIYLLSVSYAALLLDVFGGGYRSASNVVEILCLAMLVATVCGPVDSVLLMGGRSVLSLVDTGTALVINVSLDLLLVPRLGVTGAAIGWMVGILVNNLLPLWQVRRTMNMHPFGWPTALAMVLTVSSFGAIPALIRWGLGENIGSLLVAGAAASAAFAFGLFRLRQPLEISAFVSALRRRSRSSASAA